MDHWLVQLIEQGGYLGVFALMVLENVIPPIPSEAIIPLTGYLATQGQMSLLGVILAGVAGSVVGTLPWYYAAKIFGRERMKWLARRYGRWMTMHPSDVDNVTDWFMRHSWYAVPLGRLVPAVRTLIALPAGFGGMSVWTFSFLAMIGSFAWVALLAGAGYVMGAQYPDAGDLAGSVSTAIMGLAVVYYLWRVVRFKPQIEVE